MNYNEDQQLESALQDEARSVRPSPEVVHRIIDGLPRKSSPWKWFAMVPVLALIAFAFVSRSTSDQSQKSAMEIFVDAEEMQQYEELAELDRDLFLEFEDEDSDLIDILTEGSIVGIL